MTVLSISAKRAAARDSPPALRRRKLALPVALLLFLTTSPSALALSPSASPTAAPTPGGPQTDPGLILVIVVIPAVLLALIWLGYIFWLIFHEGENVGSGSPEPPDTRGRQAPDGDREPPEGPRSIG